MCVIDDSQSCASLCQPFGFAHWLACLLQSMPKKNSATRRWTITFAAWSFRHSWTQTGSSFRQWLHMMTIWCLSWRRWWRHWIVGQKLMILNRMRCPMVAFVRRQARKEASRGRILDAGDWRHWWSPFQCKKTCALSILDNTRSLHEFVDPLV